MSWVINSHSILMLRRVLSSPSASSLFLLPFIWNKSYSLNIVMNSIKSRNFYFRSCNCSVCCTDCFKSSSNSTKNSAPLYGQRWSLTSCTEKYVLKKFPLKAFIALQRSHFSFFPRWRIAGTNALPCRVNWRIGTPTMTWRIRSKPTYKWCLCWRSWLRK